MYYWIKFPLCVLLTFGMMFVFEKVIVSMNIEQCILMIKFLVSIMFVIIINFVIDKKGDKFEINF